MRSPYQPVAVYLAAQVPPTTTVTLTFAELQRILGRPLPASAWGRSWWMTRPWLPVGWRVAAVSVSGGREAVTFIRVGTASTTEILPSLRLLTRVNG